MKRTKGYISVMAEYPDYEYHLINGYAVDVEGIAAFVHKDHCAGKGFTVVPPKFAKWVVTERKSGMMMAKGFTRDIAIQNAKAQVFKTGADKVREIVDSKVKQHNIVIPNLQVTTVHNGAKIGV